MRRYFHRSKLLVAAIILALWGTSIATAGQECRSFRDNDGKARIVQCSMRGAVGETYSASINFADDLEGTPDDRQGAWGNSGEAYHQIVFQVPDGYRVRILSIAGDFLIWPIGKAPEGTTAGALLGLQTPSSGSSSSMSPGAEGTLLYIQQATSGAPARAAFDRDVRTFGLLDLDNVLVVKEAVFLNNTGLRIHMEPTCTFVFRFEPV